MAMRGVGLVPSTVTKSLICVDGTSYRDMRGRLFNPYIDGPVEFASILTMIIVLEDFFDRIYFPQPYCESRTFIPPHKPDGPRKTESEVRQYMTEEIFETEHGKKATFVVQVQFRQNATWQGTITWTEEKKTQRFRSTLEMLKLMDSAMGEIENDGNSAGIWE